MRAKRGRTILELNYIKILVCLPRSRHKIDIIFQGECLAYNYTNIRILHVLVKYPI